MTQHGEADANTSGNGYVRSDSDHESALIDSALELSHPTSEGLAIECDYIDIPHDKITALVGPNGSDKNTLLKSLTERLLPDSGSIYLGGKSISEYDGKVFTRELEMLSQQHDSPMPFTAEDLAYHGRYPHRNFFERVGDDDHETAKRTIDLVGVEYIRGKQTGNLSGGQSQFTWIATVLAQGTDALLPGEPTAYLDLHHQLRILEAVRQLNEKHDMTVAVVLRSIAQTAWFADCLVAMQNGELYDWGPSREVVTEELPADMFRVEVVINYSPNLEIVPKRSL